MLDNGTGVTVAVAHVRLPHANAPTIAAFYNYGAIVPLIHWRAQQRSVGRFLYRYIRGLVFGKNAECVNPSKKIRTVNQFRRQLTL